MNTLRNLYFNASQLMEDEFPETEEQLQAGKTFGEMIKKYGGIHWFEIEDASVHCEALAEERGFMMGFTYAVRLLSEVYRERG